MIAYLGMCLLILRQAAGIRDRFGRLLATGIGVTLATQLFIHVGVCTGLLPTTGLPLPLMSYGRSSVTAAWLSLGLVAHAVVRRPRTVAAFGEFVLVKRLHLDPVRREVTISCDNPNYPPLAPVNPADIDVAGRVIWVGRRL